MAQIKSQTIRCMSCGAPAIHYMVVDIGHPNKTPLCGRCTQEFEYDTQCVYEHEMEVFGGSWGLPSPSYYEPLPEQKEDFEDFARAIEQSGLTKVADFQELRKDAERYRWLRDGGNDDIGVVTGFDCVDVGSVGVAGTYREGLEGEQLDRAIDAAMEKQE